MIPHLRSTPPSAAVTYPVAPRSRTVRAARYGLRRRSRDAIVVPMLSSVPAAETRARLYSRDTGLQKSTSFR